MRNKIPKIPPNNELRNTSIKLTVISGYFSCKMYSAGRVKIAPATITPEQAPIDWIITFSPSAFLRLNHFVAALSSHLRDLIVSKSGGLEALLELPDSLKKRYREQAERCPLQFLYDALGITTQCESGYRASVNPRLHIEFALMRLSFICGKLNAPQPAAAPVQQPAPAPAPVAPAPSAPVAPSTPVPTPAPAAPAAPTSAEQAPEQQPRERRSRAARGGASLSMKSMMEDAPATEAVAAAEAPIPDDETLKSKWPELAKFYSNKPRLASMLTSTTIKISESEDSKTVTFRVVNDAQKDWVESKLLHELEGNYRKIVGSLKVYLRVTVTPDDAPEQKKIYMPSEQATELMKNNEEVKNLVKDLELDIK